MWLNGTFETTVDSCVAAYYDLANPIPKFSNMISNVSSD